MAEGLEVKITDKHYRFIYNDGPVLKYKRDEENDRFDVAVDKDNYSPKIRVRRNFISFGNFHMPNKPGDGFVTMKECPFASGFSCIEKLYASMVVISVIIGFLLLYPQIIATTIFYEPFNPYTLSVTRWGRELYLTKPSDSFRHIAARATKDQLADPKNFRVTREGVVYYKDKLIMVWAPTDVKEIAKSLSHQEEVITKIYSADKKVTAKFVPQSCAIHFHLNDKPQQSIIWRLYDAPCDKLVMQADNNLVAKSWGQPVWSSNTDMWGGKVKLYLTSKELCLRQGEICATTLFKFVQ